MAVVQTPEGMAVWAQVMAALKRYYENSNRVKNPQIKGAPEGVGNKNIWDIAGINGAPTARFVMPGNQDLYNDPNYFTQGAVQTPEQKDSYYRALLPAVQGMTGPVLDLVRAHYTQDATVPQWFKDSLPAGGTPQAVAPAMAPAMNTAMAPQAQAAFDPRAVHAAASAAMRTM